MKKKTSITAGLVLLFLVIFSCEQEDQIGAFKSTESENSTFKKANDPLNIVLDQEEVEEIECDQTIRRDLWAGQNILVGAIFIKKENEELVITYDLSSTEIETEWQLKESHLFVGDINDAPFTNSGNPKIGHFPYQGDHDLVNEYSFRIPLDELNDCFSIITHAVVVGCRSRSGKSSASYVARRVRRNDAVLQVRDVVSAPLFLLARLPIIGRLSRFVGTVCRHCLWHH